MPDETTLAKLLADSELNSLGQSLSERTEPHPFSSAWNPQRHALEAPFHALRYALMYPERVWERYAAQRREQGNPLSWPPPRTDGSVSGDLDPFRARHLEPVIYGINALDSSHDRYVPGPRESQNVEDRRPTSVWQFW